MQLQWIFLKKLLQAKASDNVLSRTYWLSSSLSDTKQSYNYVVAKFDDIQVTEKPRHNGYKVVFLLSDVLSNLQC